MSGKTVYIGVNDRKVDLFEGQYVVPNGVSYNSYLILDDKIAVMDTVDAHYSSEWLGYMDKALGGRVPDYLVVLHMEPDHSGSIAAFLKKYKRARIVCNAKTSVMLDEYFGEVIGSDELKARTDTVPDGGELDLGEHKLKFVFCPMVHWPEVMVAYDPCEKALFSADAFGKFGALDCNEPWDDEARRYYIGIVGKYGVQVQSALKKLGALDISVIRPLHGPCLTTEIPHALDLYNKWSSYTPETDGVLIAYTSIYGHTKAAVELLKAELDKRGIANRVMDLAREDYAECVAQAFKYSKLVIATTTYNAEIFPACKEFIDGLVERNYQNRSVAVIENGTWAPTAAKCIMAKLEKCKNLTYIAPTVTIRAALNAASRAEIAELAKNI